MSKFHNPNNPRHKRLFEFLRQEHAAETNAGSIKGYKVRRVHKDELDKIKRVAARSMFRAC